MAKPVIICIDDESIILNSLKSELRNILDATFLIELAESGQEALDIVDELLEQGYEIPLVISDYIMPEMKGDEALIKIHEKSPYTCKIMLTGQSSLEGITNAVNHASLYRFIAKPWSSNDLAITVKQAIKSYYQDAELETKNKELAELNASLEQKVNDRTQEIEAMLDQVNEQNKIIHQRNEDITDSIQYARRIQTAILPPRELINNLLTENFIFYVPRDIVSGDFYWVEKVPEKFIYEEDTNRRVQVITNFQNEKIIVAAVDCTGHGIPGAFMSLVGNDQLTTIIMHDNIVETDKILASLHQNIRRVLRQEETRNNDGMDIAICAIDMDGGYLEFSGARNSLIYIQNGEMQIALANKFSIGGYNSATEYPHITKHKIEIREPTWCYIFTDGFQDQFSSDTGKKFSIRQLRETLLAIHQLPFPEQKKKLGEVLITWMGSEKQIDDILIIGFKCHAPITV